MRIVLVDGTVLDTADPISCESFMRSHKRLVDGVVGLARWAGWPGSFFPAPSSTPPYPFTIHVERLRHSGRCQYPTHRRMQLLIYSPSSLVSNALPPTRRRVQADKELTALIRRKFAIKCTTGYSLNALVDFPVDRCLGGMCVCLIKFSLFPPSRIFRSSPLTV